MNTTGFIFTKILMEKEGLPEEIVKKYSLVTAMMSNFEPIHLILFRDIARREAEAQRNRATTVESQEIALVSQEQVLVAP